MVEKALSIVNEQQKTQTNMRIQQWHSVSNKSFKNARFIACLLVVRVQTPGYVPKKTRWVFLGTPT